MPVIAGSGICRRCCACRYRPSSCPGGDLHQHFTLCRRCMGRRHTLQQAGGCRERSSSSAYPTVFALRIHLAGLFLILEVVTPWCSRWVQPGLQVCRAQVGQSATRLYGRPDRQHQLRPRRSVTSCAPATTTGARARTSMCGRTRTQADLTDPSEALVNVAMAAGYAVAIKRGFVYTPQLLQRSGHCHRDVRDRRGHSRQPPSPEAFLSRAAWRSRAAEKIFSAARPVNPVIHAEEDVSAALYRQAPGNKQATRDGRRLLGPC